MIKNPVIAFAGRRVDADYATHAQFPASMVQTVAQRLRTLFEELRPSALVCAAAAGADLLAISVAEELNIHQHVVLPIPTESFRAYSVADRVGNWTILFDSAMARAEKSKRLSVISGTAGGTAYLMGNESILDTAERIAGSKANVVSVVAWNGRSRGSSDVTAGFLDSARRRGIPSLEVPTI